MDAFMEVQKRLTLEGSTVISVGFFSHSGNDEVWTGGAREMLDDMHKRKTFTVTAAMRLEYIPLKIDWRILVTLVVSQPTRSL